MLLPTPVFLARQLPGPLNGITDAGKDVATTATDAGKTATDAGKTATDVGKDVADQAQNGVNQFNEYKGLLESLQELEALWNQYYQWALILAIAIIVIICFSWVYCCVHCILDCRNCCCKSADRAWEEHEKEAHVPPPSPRPCCCFHWDRTYIARACGHIPVQAGEVWGFWGRRDNWFYHFGQGNYRWPDWCPVAIKTEAGRRAQKERFEGWARVVADGATRQGKQAFSMTEQAARKGIRYGKEELERGRSGVERHRRGHRASNHGGSTPKQAG